jgi:hypothetical protein
MLLYSGKLSSIGLNITTANQKAISALSFLLTVVWLKSGAEEQNAAQRTYTSKNASSFNVEIVKSTIYFLLV